MINAVLSAEADAVWPFMPAARGPAMALGPPASTETCETFGRLS